jgi:hypothetical protein
MQLHNKDGSFHIRALINAGLKYVWPQHCDRKGALRPSEQITALDSDGPMMQRKGYRIALG